MPPVPCLHQPPTQFPAWRPHRHTHLCTGTGFCLCLCLCPCVCPWRCWCMCSSCLCLMGVPSICEFSGLHTRMSSTILMSEAVESCVYTSLPFKAVEGLPCLPSLPRAALQRRFLPCAVPHCTAPLCAALPPALPLASALAPASAQAHGLTETTLLPQRDLYRR